MFAPVSDVARVGQVRVKAVVAYDGTGYSGFQRQTNALSIQAELERVLAQLVGTEVRVLASGRTDAGVHAEGQVIAFDVEWRHPLADLQRGMNALLPEQIALLQVSEVAPDFHPRYDAVRRHYRYTVFCAPVRSPREARMSLYVGQRIDLGALQLAASYLVGRHDFFAFGTPPVGRNSVREVYRAEWSTEEQFLYFDIEANAFLQRMVRMLVGSLLRVGFGALSPTAFAEILYTRDRAKVGPAASAKGLSLMSVSY